MEKCTCGGLGYIEVGGVRQPCVCKMMQIFNTHMARFKGIGKVNPRVTGLVNILLSEHKAKESKRNLPGIENSVIPRRWFMIDAPVQAMECDAIKRIGQSPKDFYMAFFFQYLVRTREYLSYKFLDLPTLMNIYYGVMEGVDATSEDDEFFYGYKNTTFLIECRNMIPNKEVYNVLRHFLNFYKDRNIIIYADMSYREGLKIRKWNGDTNSFALVDVGERSLYDILTNEYKNDFIDIFSPARRYGSKGL